MISVAPILEYRSERVTLLEFLTSRPQPSTRHAINTVENKSIAHSVESNRNISQRGIPFLAHLVEVQNRINGQQDGTDP